MSKKIVIGIPCFNEEITIGKVVQDFKKELPGAKIIVVDNNSKDDTARVSRESGAYVISEKRQGKGFAVQRIFDEFDGDILVLVDGDDTYGSDDVHKIVDPIIKEEAEMVVGDRIHMDNEKSYAKGHWWGNNYLTKSLNFLFGTSFRDMESGFRAMDKKFVQSSALLAGGFGIEPEMTIQAIEKDMRIIEVPINLGKRESGSHSKLNAMRDGTVVLYTIISLFRDYKPLQFFSLIAGILLLIGIGLGWYSIRDYVVTGIVYHIPALVVSGFFVLASYVSFVSGLILSSIKRRHDELLVIMRRGK